MPDTVLSFPSLMIFWVMLWNGELQWAPGKKSGNLSFRAYILIALLSCLKCSDASVFNLAFKAVPALSIYLLSLCSPCHLQIGPCHPPLQGLNNEPLQLLTCNISWKEFRVEIRNGGALCSGENWQNSSSDSYVFWRRNFMSPILVSSHV